MADLEVTNWFNQESAQRVTRGAALLDAHYPGWEVHVDLGRLDMLDSDLCVAGQVGNGVRCVNGPCLSGWGYVQNQHFTAGHDGDDPGFALDSDGLTMADFGFVYTEDHQTWVDLIKERFSVGALSAS